MKPLLLSILEASLLMAPFMMFTNATKSAEKNCIATLEVGTYYKLDSAWERATKFLKKYCNT